MNARVTPSVSSGDATAPTHTSVDAPTSSTTPSQSPSHPATATTPTAAASVPGGSPTAAVLLGRVARRYYLQDRSKVEIGQELGISRFKVARLLDEARASGLVHIEIRRHGEIDVDASTRLEDALGLRHALVVSTAERDPSVLRTQVSAAAAGLLTELLSPRDVLGLPWSRSIYRMVQALRWLPPVEVVQLCGAQSLPDEDANAVEVVVQAARLAGTRGHVFFAPLSVDDTATADGLRREPQIAAAIKEARRVTQAVVGVGQWRADHSTVYDLATPQERRLLSQLGVVGEMAAVCFDRDGHFVDSPMAQRLITVPSSVLGQIPDIMAVAQGPERAPAIRAAARGGLISSLVVDSGLADALLKD